ncbi:MAG: acyl-CoA dehydrogenase family protein [Candidatus Obscuribacterales bacterium]|nr:acyl-CoA dehydrogenase family protein [Candidatus Obscuribacterales bacterium]
MTRNNNDPRLNNNEDPNLAEEVLRDSGKSEDEVNRTGAIDRADEATEALFGEKARTVNSPVHRVFWDRAGIKHFGFTPSTPTAAVQEVIASAVALVQANKAAGTLYNERKKVTEQALLDIGATGYWGLRISPEFGGSGADVRTFMSGITNMAGKGCPMVAGLSSIHGCIGAVDPVLTFGDEWQKKEFLPRLASGQSLSAFALTEPGAGSDMTALKTTATPDGDDYVINGRKLFISNAIPGRTIGLVCMVPGEKHPAVIVVDLPKEENENFKLVRYNIYALKHGYNNGLEFTNFRVPKKNRLKAPADNGLIIAYHGLNYGRVALCANSAGVMRLMLRSITPESWGKFRKTYGEAIETRELVKRRVARLAALIVGADALTAWCSTLLDEGYRGELECIVAKIFGSEAQKEAAIEILMKTHGGRSFLEGHLFGDNVHDFLAPCIYEGEGEMLSMAFFKGLAKEHGLAYMLPVGKALKAVTKEGKWVSGGASFAWNGVRYATWRAGKFVRSFLAKFGLGYKQKVSGMNKRLQGHVDFALKLFTELSSELSGAMVKHQLKLADRQCRIAHLSTRVQKTLTILVTAMHGHQKGDEVTLRAADILCQDLRRELSGEQPSDAYFKACSDLADLIVAGRMTQLEGIPSTQVMQSYKQD